MTDEEIIGLFIERSEQAISELENKHGAAVKRVAANSIQQIQNRKRGSKRILYNTRL